LKIEFEVSRERIWKWIALFAYRQWSSHQLGSSMPVGVPNHRDPEYPCTAYAPRSYKLGDFVDCEGDGHHLCNECAHHRVPDVIN
jgi:hypothetical protein